MWKQNSADGSIPKADARICAGRAGRSREPWISALPSGALDISPQTSILGGLGSSGELASMTVTERCQEISLYTIPGLGKNSSFVPQAERA